MHSIDGTTFRSQLAYGRLFRNRNFVALWLGQMVSFLGDYFNWLAVPIMVERLTGSALMVGLSVISRGWFTCSATGRWWGYCSG